MGDPAGVPVPDAVCDGGDLDCGSGLLLIIRNELSPLAPGEVLEIKSRETSVSQDLPAWCRMVGHTIIATAPAADGYTRYFLRKKGGDAELEGDLEQARAYRWRVRTRWTGGMQATAYVRNHSIQIGQPASFDTEDAAPSAIEVLLAGLAGCLAVGFQWRASAHGIEVQNLEVTLNARADNILVYLGVEQAGHPGLQAVEGRAFVDADADDTVLDELWRQTIACSPLAQTLLRPVPLAVELRRA
jgi:TusA-related sulfurtransferase